MNTHEQKASATGAVGVFEGYVDDVPLVRWLDRGRMPQPGERFYSHAFVDKLLKIVAAAYQIVGAHGAPAHVLDVLARPEDATSDQVDMLLPYQSAASASHLDELAREVLSAVSWLYRRLPRGYGRQQHIEVVIERLARETGTDIADLVERVDRGPDPVEGGAS